MPDRPFSREEANRLTEADLDDIGFETRFWPFYFRVVWSVAKIVLVVLSIILVLGYGRSFISGADYEVSLVLQKALPLLGVVLITPLIVIVISYCWWYGSIALDKLLGRNDRDHR